ncbi:hypothetical protein MACK_002529 [Theileria orientalis]|uniref:Uncharacterized protein n=1 Tax=Theileria orientalis TaxID=68886 RepID=A0A976MEZ4_THEOR|nr:hypothetical protein MACK_002529 [Theileria orientalis]
MSSSKKIIFRVADGDFGQNNNIKETQENINGSNEFFKLTYTVEDSNVPMPALYKSVALLVKFENNPREEWFVRKDEVGIYWAYETSGYEKNNDLENVKNTNNYDFLKPFDFNVYEHDISKLVVSFEHVSETILGLRIFLRNGTNNCSDLELYNKNTDSISREYIYYEKKKDTLFVFFYGTDPRPLLFCYNGQMFRPHSPENYDKKWVRVQRADNLTYESGILNEKLLEILLEVTYIMNPVRINMCVKDEESNSYVTQTFYNSKKNEIKINVYHDDVGDFIRYTHESDNRGYILGEVSHNSNKLFHSYEEYNKGLSKEYKNKFPQRVSAYYHIDDHSHKYPLMISLEYESDTLGYITNNTSDYYKLTTKNNPMKWTKIQNNSSKGIKNDGDKEFLDEIQNYEEKTREMITKLTQVDQAETSIQPQTYDESELNNAIKKKLKQIIETLSIDYTKDGKNTNIAHPHKLNDDSNSGAVAGTITTLSLAGAGGGFLFYKYQAVVMSFIRGLFH